MVVLPQNFSAPSPPSAAHAQLSPLVMRVALNDLESFPWSGSGSGSTFSVAAGTVKTADLGLGVLPKSDRSLRKFAHRILTKVDRLSC